MQKAPPAGREQIKHDPLRVFIITRGDDVHRAAFELVVLECFPKRPFEGRNDPGARPDLLQLLGRTGIPVEHEIVVTIIERVKDIDDDLSIYSVCIVAQLRSEEHTSELQSLMRTSYAVFCLKKKK